LEPTSPTSPPTFSKRTGQKRLSRLVPSVDVSALSAVYTFAQKPHIMESELVAAFSVGVTLAGVQRSCCNSFPHSLLRPSS
jgi:hypothetical protein